MIQYSYENKKTDSHPTFIGRCYRSLLFSNHYWGLDFLACCPDPSRLTLVAQKSHSRTKNRDGRKIISSISVFLLFPPSNSLKEVNDLWNSKNSPKGEFCCLFIMFPIAVDPKKNDPDGCSNRSNVCWFLQEETNEYKEEENNGQWIQHFIGRHDKTIWHKFFWFTVLKMG